MENRKMNNGKKGENHALVCDDDDNNNIKSQQKEKNELKGKSLAE